MTQIVLGAVLFLGTGDQNPDLTQRTIYQCQCQAGLVYFRPYRQDIVHSPAQSAAQVDQTVDHGEKECPQN